MKELVAKIKEKSLQMIADMEQSTKPTKNKAAGVRARNAMSELKGLFKEYRKVSLEKVKNHDTESNS